MLPNPTNCFNFGQLVPRSHISLNGNKTWSAPVSSDKRSNAHPGAHSPCLLIALRPKICTVQEGQMTNNSPFHLVSVVADCHLISTHQNGATISDTSRKPKTYLVV